LASRIFNDYEGLIVELGEYVKDYYDNKVRPYQEVGFQDYYTKCGDWANLVFRCPQ